MLMSCDIYVVFISCHGSWADFFLLSLFTLLCFCHSKLSHTALLGNNLDISYSGNTDRKNISFQGIDLGKISIFREYSVGKLSFTQGIQTWKNISYSGNTDLEKYQLLREYRLVRIAVTREIQTCGNISYSGNTDLEKYPLLREDILGKMSVTQRIYT